MLKLDRGDEIVTFPSIVYSESDLGCQYLSISFHKHQLQGFMESMPTFFLIYLFKAIQKVKNINMSRKGAKRKIFSFSKYFPPFPSPFFFSSKEYLLSPNILFFSISVFLLLPKQKTFLNFPPSFSYSIFLLRCKKIFSFFLLFHIKSILLLQRFSPFSSRSCLRDPIFPYLLFFFYSGS